MAQEYQVPFDPKKKITGNLLHKFSISALGQEERESLLKLRNTLRREQRPEKVEGVVDPRYEEAEERKRLSEKYDRERAERIGNLKISSSFEEEDEKPKQKKYQYE